MKKIFLLALTSLIVSNAFSQWKNRYPKVDGYGHHVYLEGYELPVYNLGPTDPAPSPKNNQVVFSAKGWLWLYNIESSKAVRITTSSGMDSRPNWSPNGNQIVFVRDSGLDTKIMLLDVNSGKESVLVDTDRLDLDPIFSTSGEHVYYSSAKNGSFDIWKVNLANIEHSKLTSVNSLERLPIPVANGDHFVYLKKEGFSYDGIVLHNLENKSSTPLAEENFMSQLNFSLAPDNKTLVYTWPNSDDYELRLLNIHKPESRMLVTKSEGLPLSPKVSYDGEWVYFTEYNNEEYSQLKRISVYGGKPEVLAVKNWDWQAPTGMLKITSNVDGKKEAVRLSVLDEIGHPILPENGVVHSEGENGMVFFYSSGETVIQAPIGKLTITAVHGFETTKYTQTIEIEEGTNGTVIDLPRIWDASEAGWYSGDNHFHLNYGGTNRLDPNDILIDLKAEGIDIGYSLVANLGNRFLEENLIIWKNDGLPMLRFGQEVRSHFFGHLNIIGIDSLYWPWVWGPSYDIYRNDDRVNADALQFARKHNAVGGYVHPVSVRDPFTEENYRRVPTGLVADGVLGDIDILEIGCLWTDEIGTAALWHQFLNLGIPIAMSAGSDVMNDLYRTMAIGAARVYVKIDGEFTEEAFLKGLKQGKSFVSNGPQVVFTVDGKEVGDVVYTQKKKVNWNLDVYSPVAYNKVELFVNGKVVWSKALDGDTIENFTGSLEVPKGGWITARVTGEKTDWPGMDSYPYAESSPIWFHTIGSTEKNSKIEAAKKLLAVLKASKNDVQSAYQGLEIPVIMAHFKKAENILLEIINTKQ